MAKRRLDDQLREPVFSSGEAREFLGLPLPRFQDYLTRGIFKFAELEQGPRRLLRRFSAYHLMTMAAAVELMDSFAVEPSDAAEIAQGVMGDIAFEVFLREWNRPDDKDHHPALRHEFFAVANGKAFPLFHQTTVLEAATEIVKGGSFIVIDTAPIKERVGTAVLEKFVELAKSAPK